MARALGKSIRETSGWGQLGFLLSLVLVTASTANAAAPNIVIIMADDMGYSDLGCFGGEIRTPHLDQLAQGGLRFNNFYSENMCWVSRAALLTGVYHKTSMVNSTLHTRCATLPEVLRQQQYQTRMSGKWHLAGKKSTVYPLDRGFRPVLRDFGRSGQFLCPLQPQSEPHERGTRGPATNPDYYITDAISSEAVRMVKTADQQKPLFLYVAYTAAHWPLHATEKQIAGLPGQVRQGVGPAARHSLAADEVLGYCPGNDDSLTKEPYGSGLEGCSAQGLARAADGSLRGPGDGHGRGDWTAGRGTGADGPLGKHAPLLHDRQRGLSRGIHAQSKRELPARQNA